MSVSRDAVQPVFRFSCLGPVGLTSATGAVVPFRTRKQAALLFLLARQPGTPLLRNRLLDLLWSASNEASARHSLSHSVSLMNKALACEAIAPAGKDQLALAEGVVWLDVTAFEQHVRGGQPREARALWRGNLFEGLHLPRAPRFERWAETERQRLARAMREVLAELVDVERAAGAWRAMRETAEALLALDIFDEGAMLACLEASSLLGDRTLALRRFREFEALLRSELDAEPGHALRSWAQRHRRGEVTGAPEVTSAMHVSETTVLPVVQPLYGRHAEFATLWEAWESARTGHGSCVLLQGPAGIGKTALSGKLANQVHVSGGAVCVVRCFRSEKSVPFAPVSALVRQLSRLPGFVALNAIWIGELSRLVPELRERFPHIPQPMAIDDSARYRLCDAVLRAAESVAEEQPLLLVVDDLQDADEATLALLHYFGRQAATQPSALLGIHRVPSGDADFDRAFVDTARTAGFARFLPLGALGAEEMGRIFQQVLARRGLDAPPGLLGRLAASARGNPLHAIELAMAIPAPGGALDERWLQGLEQEAGGDREVFERTADERLAQLSSQARLVASALALAGRPLTDYDLAAVTRLPTSSLASAIHALETAQFLHRSGTDLAFVHERYRGRADAAIADADRHAIHHALARFLVKSAAGNPAARYEVASHYAGAGRTKEARTHAQAAARYARSVGAVRERAAALELVRRVTAGYDGRIASDLAACYLDLKEFERLDALCAEARGRGDLPRDLLDEFRYLEIAAEHHAGRTPLQRVQAALETLLAETGPGFVRALDARNLLMRTADKTGDHRTVKRVGRELRRQHADAGTRPSAHALFASAYVIAKYYWPERALPLLEEASRLAQDEQNWELEHLCRDGLGTVLKHLGRYSDSIGEIEFSLALARKTLDPLAEAASLNNIANAEMAKGNFAGALEFMRESAKIDAEYPGWPLRLYRYYNRGILKLLTGDLEAAHADLQFALSEAISIDLWPISVCACGALAICAVRADNIEELHQRRIHMERMAGVRLRALPERWTAEAAIAWDNAILAGGTPSAEPIPKSILDELRRRDVDNWLRLELEAVYIQERIGASRLPSERARIASEAEQFHAVAIRDAARAR